MIDDDDDDDSYSILSTNEKNRFLKEIGQVRQDILRFKKEMNGLAKQMDGIEIDLVSLTHTKEKKKDNKLTLLWLKNLSKDRVCK